MFVQGSVIILLRNTCLPLSHLPHILTGALETTCHRSAGLVDMNSIPIQAGYIFVSKITVVCLGIVVLNNYLKCVERSLWSLL